MPEHTLKRHKCRLWSLSGLDDESAAVKAVQEGAQDYLHKQHINGHFLSRVMRHAIERHQMLTKLRNLSLTDDLTGLYNRRGFITLAGQQLKLVERTKSGILLLFADLDGLKEINDTLGHHEGDLDLVETANILKGSFRDLDIIARIGGDEFVALAIETSGIHADIFMARLQEKLDARNAKENRRYKLSISMGIAHCDPEHPCSIDELLARVDRLMYDQKQSKLQEKPYTILLSDELTSFYSQHAFLALAEQQLKIANRTKKEILFFIVNLDNLKWINDTLGDHEGDQALIETANILKKTFRKEDIIGRFDRNKFVLLPREAIKDAAEILAARLQKNIEAGNAKANRRYKLSIRTDIAHYDPRSPCSIDKLLESVLQ